MSRYRVSVGDKSYEVELLTRNHSSMTFVIGGKQYSVALESLLQLSNRDTNTPQLAPSTSQRPIASATPSGAIVAPMPGILVQLKVKNGDTVKAGDIVAVVEAMKMENNISSTKPGKVKKVLLKEGDEVSFGQVLILIE